jgi:hypothetical protein
LVSKSQEAEGGCGVTGFACTIPVRRKAHLRAEIQMRNRGNGKGGGIAACGLVPEDFGVSRSVLEESYILQVALLDPAARGEVEKEFIDPFFDIDQGGIIPTVEDYRDVPLLGSQAARRGAVFRARQARRARPVRRREKGLKALSDREIEDEFVFQNSFG